MTPAPHGEQAGHGREAGLRPAPWVSPVCGVEGGQARASPMCGVGSRAQARGLGQPHVVSRFPFGKYGHPTHSPHLPCHVPLRSYGKVPSDKGLWEWEEKLAPGQRFTFLLYATPGHVGWSGPGPPLL